MVQGTLRWRQGLTWGALFLVASLAESALTFDHKAMGFNVAQDWNTQLATGAALAMAGHLVGAALLGLLAMRLHSEERPSHASVARDLLCGLGLALALKGLGSVVQHVLPDNNPVQLGVGAWDSIQPLLTTALHGPMGICTALAAVALALGALQFCHTRGRLVLLGSLVAVLALSASLAAETLASGVAQSLPMLLGALMPWALLRRGEVGVAIALFALTPLPRMLTMPIANAGTHAALACVMAVGLAWWALRQGRSLSAESCY